MKTSVKILHICSINNDKSAGTSVVIPKHFIHQQKSADVAILNCSNERIEALEGLKNVYYYSENNIKNVFEQFGQPDIVVFHEVYKPIYLKIVKEIKAPYVIIPHGCLTKGAQSVKALKKKIGNFLFFNKFIYGAKAIQFLSKKEYDEYAFRKNETIIMGNGIEIDKPLSERKKMNDMFVITYIGRLDTYIKGLDVLIEACVSIGDFIRKNKIVVKLYGTCDEKERSALSKMICSSNSQDFIQLNQGVFDGQKKKVLLNTDVFIQTSRSEGQPLGIMEAMAYGLPVIITPGTSFGEIVKSNNCGYVTGLTSKEIADTIIKAYNERESLQDIGKNAYKYALDNLEWYKVAETTIKEYIKLCNKEVEE